MGIPHDGKEEIGGDSPFCFAADETPKFIYASFSGMELGAFAIPPGTEFNNGIFELEQVIGLPNWWAWTGPNFQIILRQFAGNASMIVTRNTTGFITFNDNPPPCSWNFTNDRILFNTFYRLGWCNTMWIPASPGPSINELAGSLNIGESPKSFSEFWPIDGSTEIVTRFANEQESTNVAIKWNYDP